MINSCLNLSLPHITEACLRDGYSMDSSCVVHGSLRSGTNFACSFLELILLTAKKKVSNFGKVVRFSRFIVSLRE